MPPSISCLPIEVANHTEGLSKHIGTGEHIDEEPRGDVVLEVEAVTARQSHWGHFLRHRNLRSHPRVPVLPQVVKTIILRASSWRRSPAKR
jgi:hypothetical protein